MVGAPCKMNQASVDSRVQVFIKPTIIFYSLLLEQQILQSLKVPVNKKLFIFNLIIFGGFIVMLPGLLHNSCVANMSCFIS